MLDASAASLERRFSDVALKIRDFYRAGWEHVRARDSIPLRLFGSLLILGKIMAIDTQDIEGMNNTLQAMAKAAPRMGEVLASDRLCIKVSDRPSVSECVNVHSDVLVRMNTP